MIASVTSGKLLLAIMLVAVWLPACSTLELRVETPGAPPVESTASAASPTVEPTGVQPTPAPTAEPAVLPAPVYFISTADEQLWRIAPDGRTLTRITAERAPVIEFNLSPDGGALVYVTENLLVRASAGGDNRVVLVTGPAMTGAEDDVIARQIHSPRWSPDGAQIAFGLNGVNLIAAEGGQPQMIQPSDPVPTTRTLARFYRPYSWSPDGTRLVVEVFFWQEGLIYAVKNLVDGALLDIESACCSPVWSRDGRSLYMTNSSPEGYSPPGLWRVDASTGQAVTLIEGRREGDPLVNLAANPFETADGYLYFLLAAQSPNADGIYEWPQRFQLGTLPASAGAGLAPILVRAEARSAFEADWSGDGSGLVIREIDPTTQPLRGALIWLPADPALPVVTLPADGIGARMGATK